MRGALFRESDGGKVAHPWGWIRELAHVDGSQFFAHSPGMIGKRREPLGANLWIWIFEKRLQFENERNRPHEFLAEGGRWNERPWNNWHGNRGRWRWGRWN